jgi:hypothetical protein
MGDENQDSNSIISTSKASQLAELCINNPESIYDQIVRAEKWIKELKDIARDSIIARMPETAITNDIETNNYTVHTNKNKAKLKPEVIHKALMAIGLDPYLVVYKLPVEHDALPNARDTLEIMRKSGVIPQSVYDTFFAEPGYTVTIKPKNAKTIVSGE